MWTELLAFIAGGTLVAIPALWTVKQAERNAARSEATLVAATGRADALLDRLQARDLSEYAAIRSAYFGMGAEPDDEHEGMEYRTDDTGLVGSWERVGDTGN